ITATDSRACMSGFYTSEDPLPQNFEQDRKSAPHSRVVAQIRDWEPSSGRIRISVRNPIREGDALELLTPQGTTPFRATQLVNPRGKSVSSLHGGMEHSFLSCLSPPPLYSFLVKHNF
ncbi:MAG TPA: U32 family peptidase C-terminal domain-containing protein, partial [Fibrobacteraceae bacterium]|nr:U32 family peptidase C-terminal domain-containing protein [Fibrobacteraceae bacterium]